MKQLYLNVAVFGTTVLSYHSLVWQIAHTSTLKRMTFPKDVVVIVLEGQTEEQTDKPKKIPCADPGIVSGSPDQSDRKKALTT